MGLTQKLGTIPLAILTDSSNNVGIGGSANASFKLQVTGTTNLTGALSGTSATFSSTLAVGTTLSAWDTGTFPDILQVGNASLVTLGNAYSQLGNNSYYDGTNYRYISNGGAQRMVYDDSGNIIWATAASGTAGNTFTFSERMRITSGGNVLIGASSTSDSVSSRIYLRQSTDNDFKGLVLVSASAGEFAGSISMDSGGNLSFAHSYLAGGGSFQGIKFTTSGSERMRITSGGVLCVGGTNENPAANATNGIALTNGFLVSINRNNDFGLDIGRNGTDGAVASFRRGSTQVGTISVTGSATAYNTSSDYRLKQDLKDYNGLNLISEIKTYDYEWKSDNTRAFGVMAHELAEVIPYAVIGEKDGEEMQGVDYSKIVPILVKAIQEQQAQIDELKAKIK
jgi:hypothetical protein